MMLKAIAMESGDVAERTGLQAVACAITYAGSGSRQTNNINTNFRVLCRDKGPSYAHLQYPKSLSEDNYNILQHFDFKMSIAPKSLWVHLELPPRYPSQSSHLLTSDATDRLGEIRRQWDPREQLHCAGHLAGNNAVGPRPMPPGNAPGGSRTLM